MRKPLKSLSLFLALAVALLPCASIADGLLVKKNAQTPITGLLVSSTDGTNASSGATVTVSYRKSNQHGFTTGAGTVTYDGFGVFDYTPTTGETDTPGPFMLDFQAPGMVEYTREVRVVAFDPDDVSLLGLTGIATAATQATNTTTLGTINTNTAATNTQTSAGNQQANVTAGMTTQGYTTARAPKLDYLDAAVSSRSTYAGTDTPGTTLLLGLTNTGHTAFTAPALANAPSGGGGGGTGLTAQQTANAVLDEPLSGHTTAGTVGAALTAFTPASFWGYTTRSLTDKGNFTLASGEYANIAGGLLTQALITIPTTGTTTGVSETLTYKQFTALSAALVAGSATNTAPTPSGSGTVTYYLVGAPKTSGNVVAVSTPTFDAGKVISGRTILVAQPFPAVN